MASSKIQASELAKSINWLATAMNLERGYDEATARKMGYFSIQDFAKHSGYSESHATRILKDAVKANIAESIYVISKRGKRLFYKAK